MQKDYAMKNLKPALLKSGAPIYVKSLILLITLLALPLSFVNAQVGQVLWEDNFDTLDPDLWTPDIGDGCAQGICGWGNQELQSYQAANNTIEDIPGEAGNKALVLTARREQAGSSAFTSGKVTTENKVAIQYGLIETRIKVPDLESGLWPAAWLLGTSNLIWPAKGEIDMMEMGFGQEERNRQLEPNSTRNTYVGANAFFPIPDNGGVGNIAFDVDYNTPYVADQPLNERFVIYRLYWTPESLRFTVVDNGVERDLYAGPLPIDVNGPTAPFARPFYMLLNLAVGGTLPQIIDPNGITAPIPGKMLIDYVRVSEYNGFGSVEFGDGNNDIDAETGTFGVFTENTPTSNSLNFGGDADIFVFSDTFSEGSEAPFEGDEVITWNFNAGSGFFGAGITSLFGKNMENYAEEGTMKFRIKIPADVTFRIGITDNFTNEQYITFPAGETKFGLVRNGEWGQVSIPLSEYQGLLAFQNLAYLFILSSDGTNVPGNSFPVAIDDIYWEDGSGVVGCQPTAINASATINGEQTGQTSLTVEEGDDVVLSPTAADGSWSWSGPNNFSSTQRQVTLNNIQTANAGSYTATFTNDCGATSTSSYTISLNAVDPPNPPNPPTGDIKTWTSLNIAGKIIRHAPNGRARIDDNVTPVESGQWRMVTGLAGSGVSFQSVDSPNKYLRHRGSQLWLDDVQSNQLFIEDATFLVRDGLADASLTSFEAFNFPGRYIRHRNSVMYVEAVNSDLGRNDATFSENGDGGGGGQDDNNGDECSQVSANGDFTAQITENGDGTSLTFVPAAGGTGSQVTILYYSTDENGIFPGYGVSPNEAKALNVEAGQTVYYYYTYNVAGAGERNTLDNKQSFTAGSCSAGTAQSESSAFKVYPNPVKDELRIKADASAEYHTAVLLNGLGQELERVSLKDNDSPTLQMSNLPRGIYVVRMIAEDHSETSKVIK